MLCSSGGVARITLEQTATMALIGRPDLLGVLARRLRAYDHWERVFSVIENFGRGYAKCWRCSSPVSLEEPDQPLQVVVSATSSQVKVR